MSPDPDFARQGRYKPQPNCVSGVSVDIVGKHGELIPAEPCQEITRPSGRPKALGNDLQHAIPQRVAVEIIHALEVVEVYQEECVLAAISRRRRGCCRQCREQRSRIEVSVTLPTGQKLPQVGRLAGGGYEFDPQTQVMEVLVEIPNPNLLLRPGLAVTLVATRKPE